MSADIRAFLARDADRVQRGGAAALENDVAETIERHLRDEKRRKAIPTLRSLVAEHRGLDRRLEVAAWCAAVLATVTTVGTVYFTYCWINPQCRRIPLANLVLPFCTAFVACLVGTWFVKGSGTVQRK
eukprot:Sspe_Gene.56392::Locus_31024_Transcript_1_1_Confidence_1.000_Length_652::g.56392::m.56392